MAMLNGRAPGDDRRAHVLGAEGPRYHRRTRLGDHLVTQNVLCRSEATTAMLDGPHRRHPAAFAQDPLPGELRLEAPLASPLLLEGGQRRFEEPVQLLRRGAQLGR